MQTRPDQTRTDQTRPDQTRPGQARPGQAKPYHPTSHHTRLSYARPLQARPGKDHTLQTSICDRLHMHSEMNHTFITCVINMLYMCCNFRYICITPSNTHVLHMSYRCITYTYIRLLNYLNNTGLYHTHVLHVYEYRCTCVINLFVICSKHKTAHMYYRCNIIVIYPYLSHHAHIPLPMIYPIYPTPYHILYTSICYRPHVPLPMICPIYPTPLHYTDLSAICPIYSNPVQQRKPSPCDIKRTPTDCVVSVAILHELGA